MTIELWILIGCVGMLFTLIMVQQIHVDLTVGAKYALSNRTEPKPFSPFGGRVDRAIENLKENLVLFSPIVLVLSLAGISTGLTQLGAILFFLARVVHAVTYVLGITIVRSLAWMAGIVAMGMMVVAVFLQR